MVVVGRGWRGDERVLGEELMVIEFDNRRIAIDSKF